MTSSSESPNTPSMAPAPDSETPDAPHHENQGLVARFPKQAIIVVHGMGEQRPMDTIKSFVKTVWQNDPAVWSDQTLDPAAVWSKPDARAGSLELRRITTRESTPSPKIFDRGVRSDFFELYWADLTAGTPWEEFKSWLFTLLLRDPFKNVPKAVLPAWIVLWLLTITFVVLTTLALIPAKTEVFGWAVPDFGSARGLVVAAIAVLVATVHSLVQKTFGRVARYTRSTPGNIAARQAVRERGLALLTALHNDPEYCRIVIVSHSLGTIFAYELLAFFWAREQRARCLNQNSREFEALAELETLWPEIAQQNPSKEAREKWEVAQRKLRRSLAARPAQTDIAQQGSRWIISDFITLGSPLTHAEFLMAQDKYDLEARQMAREMPVCPPVRERLDQANIAAAEEAQRLPIGNIPNGTALFSFPWRDEEKTWEMHYAAPFAVVRWTNIYDPAKCIYKGDLISGPLQSTFGHGIKDINLKDIRGQSTGFSHTLYWDERANYMQLEELRRAVNILDLPN